jgi:hypothetical protein
VHFQAMWKTFILCGSIPLCEYSILDCINRPPQLWWTVNTIQYRMWKSKPTECTFWLIYYCFNYTYMFRLLPGAIIRESSWPYELETVAAI